MTIEAKHALIAERLEGFRQVLCNCKNCLRLGRQEMMLAEVPPEWEGSIHACVNYDNVYENEEFQYSTNLNLVARVEAKVAEMGMGSKYALALGEVLVMDAFYPCRDDLDAFITASATARVDALVALIESGVV